MRKKARSVDKIVIADQMKYEGVTILDYRIEYPEFKSDNYKVNIKAVNDYYRDKALALENNFRTKLYQMALTQYLYDVENGFPFNAYEALQVFEVTYNQACIISLYFDNYEYTGGAHGLTTRSSQTWNLRFKRRTIKLKDLYGCSGDYRSYFKKKIIAQIKEDPEFYFDNYEELVDQTFNINSFYTNPEGIVIYFQQYDIAPYSSGIREFLIPYNKCVINPIRKCKK